MVNRIETRPSNALVAEIEAMGIRPSKKERACWFSDQIDWWTGGGNFKGESAEVKKAEVKRRLDQTLDLMSVSENPFFRSAVGRLADLSEREQFSFDYVEGHIAGPQYDSEMITKLGSYQESLFYVIQISTDFTLEHHTPLSLASKITHEAEHVKNIHLRGFINPDSPEELKEREGKRSVDKKGAFEEELSAYTVEVQAYLLQRALLWPDLKEKIPAPEQMATFYARTRRQAVPERSWRAFIDFNMFN